MLQEFVSALAVFVLFGVALGAVVGWRALKAAGADTRCADVAAELPSCDDIEALPEILWTTTGRIVYRKK